MKDLYVQVYKEAPGDLAERESFKDISGLFSNQTKPYYIDYAHLSEAGNELVARRMVADIAPLVKNMASQKGSRE